MTQLKPEKPEGQALRLARSQYAEISANLADRHPVGLSWIRRGQYIINL